jgi:hypothetical protein
VIFARTNSRKEIVDPKNGFINTSWTLEEWRSFFSDVTPKSYASAFEQWNDETRKELIEKL